MNENQRVRRNKYQAKRRKHRNQNRIDRQQEDLLYEEARIDPDTVDGQSRLSIERLNSNKEKPLTQENQNEGGWLSYLTFGWL
jgi:hypothetical protein